MLIENFLSSYVAKQINNFFPSQNQEVVIDLALISGALNRTNTCLSKIKGGAPNGFNYLNSGQYATFLYYLSNIIWKKKVGVDVATKIFLLNKALNGIDLYYEIEMPDFFLIGHTVGMVFAKALYSDYCIFHQGCTVGRVLADRPILEKGVVLYPNSSVIGACHVKENTVLSAGVHLINIDTPGNCYVFMGEKGRPVFKEIDEYFADRYFDRDAVSNAS